MERNDYQLLRQNPENLKKRIQFCTAAASSRGIGEAPAGRLSRQARPRCESGRVRRSGCARMRFASMVWRPIQQAIYANMFVDNAFSGAVDGLDAAACPITTERARLGVEGNKDTAEFRGANLADDLHSVAEFKRSIGCYGDSGTRDVDNLALKLCDATESGSESEQAQFIQASPGLRAKRLSPFDPHHRQVDRHLEAASKESTRHLANDVVSAALSVVDRDHQTHSIVRVETRHACRNQSVVGDRIDFDHQAASGHAPRGYLRWEGW
jgi:hypothetical protein